MREYLKVLRRNNAFTQRYTADRLGISQNYYSCIENGKKQKKISLELLLKMADLFGVTVAYLINEEAKVKEKKEA